MFDKDRLEELISNESIKRQKHPTKDLFIYKYTRTVQAMRNWCEITLNCRGVILDREGNVVGRPFPKFFNWEEHLAETCPVWYGNGEPTMIPNPNYDDFSSHGEILEIHNKADGSFGILFYHDGEWEIASGGSFNSNQSRKANKILKDQYPDTIPKLDTEYTYLLEIIYPENRIVVDYKGETKLVLLGVIHTETGEDIFQHEYEDVSEIRSKVNPEMEPIRLAAGHGRRFLHPLWNNGLPRVEVYHIDYNGWGFAALSQLEFSNKEGFIARFQDGFRTKVKFGSYKEIHFRLGEISSKAIWEKLREGKTQKEIMEDTPDESDDFVLKWIKELEMKFMQTKVTALKEWELTVRRLGDETGKSFAIDQPRRKELAKEVFTNKEIKHANLILTIQDGRNLDDKIWERLRPKGERPVLGDADF